MRPEGAAGTAKATRAARVVAWLAVAEVETARLADEPSAADAATVGPSVVSAMAVRAAVVCGPTRGPVTSSVEPARDDTVTVNLLESAGSACTAPCDVECTAVATSTVPAGRPQEVRSRVSVTSVALTVPEVPGAQCAATPLVAAQSFT